jgi:hypothetical protein
MSEEDEAEDHNGRTKFVRPITISNEGRNQSNKHVTMNFYSNRPTTMGGNVNNGSRPMTISNFSRNQAKTTANSNYYQSHKSKFGTKQRNEFNRHISTANQMNKRSLMKMNVKNNNEYKLI